MEAYENSVFNQKLVGESDLININKYFSEYANLINFTDFCKKLKTSCEEESCKNDEFYRNFMGISEEQLKELKERTSIELLKSDDDYPEENMSLNDEVNAELKVSSPLISVKKHQEMTNVTKSQFYRKFYKYTNYEWCKTNIKPINEKLGFDTLQFPTVVVCIKVYHPIVYDQTLSEFKDKILCSLDHMGDKDLSNDCFLKNVGFNITAKDEYPSSFIFMEDTFYNDTRSSKMTDISKEITEWAAEKGLGCFKTATMESTKIADLKFRVGRPYVYQHLGNCEHIIMFSDVRLLDVNDPPRFSNFPYMHCAGRVYGKHCMMCSDHYARWIVVGNPRLTHDKAYLCNKCFISYNYIDKKKIGEFQAYKYVDLVALL